MEVLADNHERKSLQAPNDVTMDSNGRLYSTDFVGAAVYRIDTPGTLTHIRSHRSARRDRPFRSDVKVRYSDD